MKALLCELFVAALVATGATAFAPVDANQHANRNRVTVEYDIGHLPVWRQETAGPWTPDTALLITAMTSSIAPQSWDETTLIRQTTAHTLVVTHSPPVQRKIEAFLRKHARDGRPVNPEEHVSRVFE